LSLHAPAFGIVGMRAHFKQEPTMYGDPEIARNRRSRKSWEE
jgi:hypothetical protein